MINKKILKSVYQSNIIFTDIDAFKRSKNEQKLWFFSLPLQDTHKCIIYNDKTNLELENNLITIKNSN